MRAVIVPLMLILSIPMVAFAASWMLVLPESLLNVGATRAGHGLCTGAQMATMHPSPSRSVATTLDEVGGPGGDPSDHGNTSRPRAADSSRSRSRPLAGGAQTPSSPSSAPVGSERSPDVGSVAHPPPMASHIPTRALAESQLITTPPDRRGSLFTEGQVPSPHASGR
jgi:hypothetical protein